VKKGSRTKLNGIRMHDTVPNLAKALRALRLSMTTLGEYISEGISSETGMNFHD
jgi:hypothetical protein